jgi:phosphoribosylaminoimidazole (AIR) synthetase
MYRVFNMGIGFCLILKNDPSVISAVRQTFATSHFDTHIIGTVVADERKRVVLPKQGLVGEGEEFKES